MHIKRRALVQDLVSSCRDQRLLKACQLVAEDLTKRPTLREVADLAGVERTYFCKVFRETTGVRFSDWNRRIRIDHAKRLLAAYSLCVTAVAAAVGYDDVTTFAGNFRKLQGISPTHYRRLHGRRTLISLVTTIAENSTTCAETPPGTERSLR